MGENGGNEGVLKLVPRVRLLLRLGVKKQFLLGDVTAFGPPRGVTPGDSMAPRERYFRGFSMDTKDPDVPSRMVGKVAWRSEASSLLGIVAAVGDDDDDGNSHGAWGGSCLWGCSCCWKRYELFWAFAAWCKGESTSPVGLKGCC